MRMLGIDYGSKRVGIALSDETHVFALPLKVLTNSKTLLEDIIEIVHSSNADRIVMGESKNYKGADNAIMKDILGFKEKLEERLKTKVRFEPEFMTSDNAERFQGKNDMHDASAAALILQSYLDRLNAKSDTDNDRE